jgi:hypothetical protein
MYNDVIEAVSNVLNSDQWSSFMASPEMTDYIKNQKINAF